MMNNTINEVKNSLEGINSRITEAEERISDLEDKIVEITTTEQNKEKRMKRIEDKSQRPLGQHVTHQHSSYRGPRRKRERKKGTEKIFEEIILENFPNMAKEIVKSKKCRESDTG